MNTIFEFYLNKNDRVLKNFNEILDIIIPECKDRSLPSASQIKFDKIVKLNDFYIKIFDSLIEFDNVENQKFDYKKFKKNNFKLIYELSLEVLKFYYSNETVLKIISKNSVPPFPNGNQIEKGNIMLLEEVYNKGKIYKEII